VGEDIALALASPVNVQSTRKQSQRLFSSFKHPRTCLEHCETIKASKKQDGFNLDIQCIEKLLRI
jgi:hypothetical protein